MTTPSLHDNDTVASNGNEMDMANHLVRVIVGSTICEDQATPFNELGDCGTGPRVPKD